MHDDCTERESIRKLEVNSQAMDSKLDLVIENQKILASDLKQTLDRLTKIIEEDIGTRKDVEQGKKERAILFDKVRSVEQSVVAIGIRNARCDGAGIFENFPVVWAFVQQEKGVRRFIPYALTVLMGLMTLYSAMEM